MQLLLFFAVAVQICLASSCTHFWASLLSRNKRALIKAHHVARVLKSRASPSLNLYSPISEGHALHAAKAAACPVCGGCAAETPPAVALTKRAPCLLLVTVVAGCWGMQMLV